MTIVVAKVRLYRPCDAFGRLISWRLESEYSHATIEFNGTIYSATFPKVVAVSEYDKSFGMPPRTGDCYEITLTEEQAAKGEAWFKAQVGTSYDIGAMAAWAFRIPSWQSTKTSYCFDSVQRCLVAAGVFQETKTLITGDELLVDLYQSGVLHLAPISIARHVAAMAVQKPATVVKER